MRRISQLRIARDHNKIASSEQRTSARQRRSLHARHHRNIDRAQRIHARAQAVQKFLDRARLLRACRKIESGAKSGSIASEQQCVGGCIARGPIDAIKEFPQHARIKRVAARRIAKRDAREPIGACETNA